MSVDDYGTGAQPGQPQMKRDGSEFESRQGRLALGIVTKDDIISLFEISSHTVTLWETKGLKGFRPGTKCRMFLVSDIAEFLGRRETFAGKNGKKPKKGRSHGKKTGPEGVV